MQKSTSCSRWRIRSRLPWYNVLHAASAQSAQEQLKYERDRLRLVLEINNAVVSHLELRELLKAISGCSRTCDPARSRVVLSL